MLRLGGIFFKVAPQADDEVVDGARVGVLVQAPDVLKNGFAGYISAIVPDEVAQQFRFH